MNKWMDAKADERVDDNLLNTGLTLEGVERSATEVA